LLCRYVSDDGAVSPPKPKKLKPKSRAVLGVLVLEEFMKELVALVLTHAVDLGVP
jgi:hypothetical protein